MKRFTILLSTLALVLSLCACGVAPAVNTSTPPAVTPSASVEPSAVPTPAYNLVDSSKYVRDGKDCIGYRVEIGDSATEEGMRAVFAELSAADSYYLHTVWFYGLASDVEDVGSYTVGMLEETAPSAEPVFTASTYDAATIASLRERSAQEEDARSIPSPTFQQEALVPDNSFMPAPAEIFSTPASENGLGDHAFFIEGKVEERSEVSGYDSIRVSTDAGEIWVSGVTIPLGEIAEGDDAVVYLVYTGWSETLGAAAGAYVYHE